MPKRLHFFSALFIATLTLTACGFQLRGTGGYQLPEEWRQMHLVSESPNGELSREVRNSFAATGIEWVTEEDANYALVLGEEEFKQENLSISAQARAAEFELTMRTRFSVIDSQGNEVIPPTTSSVKTQMENDPRNPMGKSEELRILKSEMRRELAQNILRRTSFFAAGN